ncbi:MAG: hypothetical protein V4598_01085 [Bdellovibrionota bacterium]
MKYYLALLSLIFVLPVFAEEPSEDRVQRCRMMRNSKARMYVEDLEYCQGVMMRDSLNEFNAFLERRGPVVDCQEAKQNPDLVNACRAVGITKVKAQARAWGSTVRDQDVYACDVDNSHWIMPNYVWFCADTPKGKVQQITQKPLIGSCF